jgi:Mg2+ and Co2+ transporter CorA
MKGVLIMNTNVNNKIEDLKKIVLDMYRSAGNLDNIIQCLEQDYSIEYPQEHRKMYTRIQCNYRNDFKRANNYEDFDAKEKCIWAELINGFSNKEIES